MRILNFNIRFGGGKRTPKIIDYMLTNDFDMIVLTEFINNSNGREIIDKLVDKGYKTQPSNQDGKLGSFIACKENFVTKNIEDRWIEIYIPKKDLYLLGVYVPVSGGAEKNLFWKKILDYSKENADNNVMIMGDFNSCTKDDSANQTDYNPKDLIELEGIGYIDLWKSYRIDKSDRYTWYHPTGTGFRIDYTFVSPKLGASLQELSALQDSKMRESNISDHSPLIIDWKSS